MSETEAPPAVQDEPEREPDEEGEAETTVLPPAEEEASALSPEQLANIKAIKAAQEAEAKWEAPETKSVEPSAHDETVMRWNKYLSKELKAEYGEDGFARLHLCPLCQYTETPGYVVLQRPPDEVVSVVRQILQVRDPASLEKDKHSQKCTECKGKGIVSMDNEVPGQESMPCVNCKGRGWTATDEKRQDGYVATALPPAAPNGAPTPLPAPADLAPLPPEAEALRRLGYIVVPPSTAAA